MSVASSASRCACAIHLLHPATSRNLIHVASPNAQVDVGTIAAHFSLQPASLRFNGHFISRDANFISGLTWRDLISFFLSKGFSSGSDALDPVRVEGYPSIAVAEASCDEEHRKGKRAAVECHLGSPLKRVQRENRQAFIPSSKSKRDLVKEPLPSCTTNKRVQHEVHSEVQRNTEGGQGHEAKAILGLKRPAPVDDILGDRALWKRMKEIRV